MHIWRVGEMIEANVGNQGELTKSDIQAMVSDVVRESMAVGLRDSERATINMRIYYDSIDDSEDYKYPEYVAFKEAVRNNPIPDPF